MCRQHHCWASRMYKVHWMLPSCTDQASAVKTEALILAFLKSSVLTKILQERQPL